MENTEPKIVTVWAPKGGVGKTTIAYELAYMLDAPLIDLEWDDGSASVQWGLKEPEPPDRSRLIRAFKTGKAAKAHEGRPPSRPRAGPS